MDTWRIPIGDWSEVAITWMTDTFASVFDLLKAIFEGAYSALDAVLNWPPAWVILLAFGLIGLVVRGWRFVLLTWAGLSLIVFMDQWENAMHTISLVAVASVVATVVAIPVGIAAARSDRVSTLVRPVLDFMQTMPAFVYLIPAVVIFSVGTMPGIMATIIFAMPPGVRLTELGIRQVDHEVVEAGHAFGTTPGRILRQIQLPLAMPSIMAGINQVIMLALSMTVIAGLTGGPGLGRPVLEAISTLNIGLGFEAGLAVVIVAIYLDRVTAALGQRTSVASAQRVDA
jgi:glycine betaine/proline transport system permease protein